MTEVDSFCGVTDDVEHSISGNKAVVVIGTINHSLTSLQVDEEVRDVLKILSPILDP